ncbi:MAG: Peptidase dimerization domain protein [Verrucomicrobiales bacterium]|nr:Peptidase dimerization domain protein [Verrucomicrobiales bacterium]
MSPATKLLRELVALPSVNPAFLPDKHPYAGEQRVAEFLAAVSASAGLDVMLEDVFPNRPNLLARLTPPGKIKQTILLAPHFDTVGVSSEKQFSPQIKNGRLYARGACDTKGSVATMLTALITLAKSKQRPSETEIIFCGLIDEENAQSGSRALGKSLKADLAIVGEPTRLKLVTAHKGSLWLKFETRGKSAHGAKPELGVNAVHEAARIVDLLETDYAAALGRKKHPLLGRATINVGTMHGGVQPNIVPDHCVITADRRTLPGETELTVQRELRALLKKKKLRAILGESKSVPGLPLETNPKLPLVQQMLRSFGQPKPAGVDYFCDASVLAQAGIPSVVFGPGDIAQAHTTDEWLSLAELDKATRMLIAFFETLS